MHLHEVQLTAYLIIPTRTNVHHIRDWKFSDLSALAGTRCGDIWTHVCCCFCALCQETRTLMQNNVVAGTWHGTASAAMKNLQHHDAYHHDASRIWPQGLLIQIDSLLTIV